MTATVVVQECTGGSNGSPSYQTVTNRIRLMTTDAMTTQSGAQTTNPVVIPSGAGFNYSYWKSVCLDISGSPFTSVSNIKHYSNGDANSTWTMGTGGQLLRGNTDTGDKGLPTANYTVAIGTAGTTGNAMDSANPNGIPYYAGQTTKTGNVAADNGSGNAIVIDSTSHTTAGKSNMIVLQCKVANDATQGTMTAITLTWLYDES